MLQNASGAGPLPAQQLLTATEHSWLCPCRPCAHALFVAGRKAGCLCCCCCHCRSCRLVLECCIRYVVLQTSCLHFQSAKCCCSGPKPAAAGDVHVGYRASNCTTRLVRFLYRILQQRGSLFRTHAGACATACKQWCARQGAGNAAWQKTKTMSNE